MEVICDHVERIEPIKNGQDYPVIRLLLDDADASGLMRQLVEQLDAEVLLDYFKDSVIEEYLAERKSTALSPREQQEQFINAFFEDEVIEAEL